VIVVLDASAALEVVLKRKHSSQLISFLSEADWVITPMLFISEVSNAIWKYHRFANLSLGMCERCLEQAIALPDEFFSERELYREAFMLSCMVNHPVYDAIYLVLARRNNGVLLSLDQKLTQLAKGLSVRSIG